jgi:hypothetical protein
MFIHLGKKNRVLKVYPDIDSKCDECDSNTKDYIISQSYYHLWGIPVVPLLKSVSTYCHNCLDLKENVHNSESEYYESKTRTPIYMYSVIIILILLFAISITRSLL